MTQIKSSKPEFGYSRPRRTKKPCSNPAFADERTHLVGKFADAYCDDGLKGYSVKLKCVNCGVEFNFKGGASHSFVVSERLTYDTNN